MMSEYGKQLKAFFHFMFKHIFEVEFGIKISIEILVFLILICMLLKILHKIFIKSSDYIDFINRELIIPLRVRLFEKLAFSTNNPNWQERANKIKDAFKEEKDERNKKKDNKSYAVWWIALYIVLVAWILGFHYWGEEKRNSYEVFFLGEKAILAFEDWTTNSLFNTDEYAIECFFHNLKEMN